MNLKILLVLLGASAFATAAHAGVSPLPGDGHTIQYVSRGAHSTDIDLGEPGVGAGDQQVFLNDVIRHGTKIGHEAGVCQVVLHTTTRLIASCHATVVLPGGTITTQGVFHEDPRVGPTGLTLAVTGGTGRYRGAGGQSVARPVPNSDDGRITIRLN